MEQVVQISERRATARGQRLWTTIRPLIYLLPAFVPLIVFWIYPMLYSIWLSFTNWDFISPTYDVVGVQNYEQLLTDANFYAALWHTLYLAIGTIIPTIVIGLLLAMLTVKKLRGQTVYRALFFAPWLTPMVAVSIVWSWIFEPRVGLANFVIEAFGGSGVGWTGSSTWAMPAIIIVTVWKGVGWAMLFYIDALQKISPDLYEAANLDGANGWRKLWHITLPLVSPTTFFLTVVTLIDSLQAYDQIQILTQGGPAGSTRTLLYMYYQLAFEQFNVGQATALATVIVGLTLLISLVQFVVAKRWVHYE